MVVVSRFIGAGFILMRVLDAVLRDDRGVLPHQYVNKVILIWIHRVSGFRSFFCDFI
jgi:hypothetical protein